MNEARRAYAAAALVLFSSPRAAWALGLEEVLARQARATCGAPTVKTVQLEARMVEPQETYDLSIRFAARGAMRIDLRKLGVSVYSEGLGSRGPWQQHLLQWSPRRTSKAGGEAIRMGAEAFAWGRTLSAMRARGHAIQLLESGSPAHEVGVRVRFRSGSERRYFLDRATFRIVRSEQTYALHPDMAGAAATVRRIETAWLDYRRIGRCMLPMRLVNRDRETGQVVQTITVRDVRLDEPIDAEAFEER